MKKAFMFLIAAVLLCAVISSCGEGAQPQEAPVFSTIGEARADSRAEHEGITEEYYCVILNLDGRYVCYCGPVDERCWELYGEADGGKGSPENVAAYYRYVDAIPVGYTCDVDETPKSRAELDAFAGRSLYDVLEEGYTCLLFYVPGEAQEEDGFLEFVPLFQPDWDMVLDQMTFSSGSEENKVVMYGIYGAFAYYFELNEPYAVFREHAAGGDTSDLTVRSAEYAGFSGDYEFIDYHP